ATAAGKSAECKVTVLYKDVTNAKDFWYAPTNYLTAKGVVKGYDKQTKFKPANDCTRAQMLTFMWRLQGEPAPKAKTCKFPDVKKTDYFFKPVIWAVEQGITTGYKDGTFKPQNVCTRAQTVTFLWRMAKTPSPSSKTCKFSDVKSKDYFYKPVIWASEKKIVAGYNDGTFRPQGKCLRRQMVTFLYKYDKYINKKE
ncbi:MAG: S-layer homology domain-containing protein, partial [Clostridiales bacterium]|nr:S-layer homology domain-containing protein [Clostridiales bacterium]